MARKHVCAPQCRNVVPTESHNGGQNAGYFPRTLRTVLVALGSSEPPLFIGTLRLHHGNSFLWHVHVVIYVRRVSKEEGGGVRTASAPDTSGRGGLGERW
jgi:hypothetical protein